jgi:hypothetical protein
MAGMDVALAAQLKRLNSQSTVVRQQVVAGIFQSVQHVTAKAAQDAIAACLCHASQVRPADGYYGCKCVIHMINN